jgi:hypothetical protein
LLEDPELLIQATSGGEEAPYKSRFKKWIRTVSLLIVLIFLPEQVSWAFNYNPLVLWSPKTVSGLTPLEHEMSPAEMSSFRVASSVNNLLSQIANQERTRVQLNLNNNSNSLSDRKILSIDSATAFTPERIQEITSWLSRPEIHPLNCGVYALRDILKANKIEAALEEISVSTLSVDFMSNIIKAGDPKLKTSLYAIQKVAQAYGLSYKAAKVKSENVLKLPTPFIANFNSEHFVVVTSVDAMNVNYLDIGRTMSLPVEENSRL